MQTRGPILVKILRSGSYFTKIAKKNVNQPLFEAEKPLEMVPICENFGKKKPVKSTIFEEEKSIWVRVSDLGPHTLSRNNSKYRPTHPTPHRSYTRYNQGCHISREVGLHLFPGRWEILGTPVNMGSGISQTTLGTTWFGLFYLPHMYPFVMLF